MNFLSKLPAKQALRFQLVNQSMFPVQARTFYYPDAHHHHMNQEPHVIVKRVIKCVGDRLRHIDPHRWDGVPITYKTHWKNEAGHIDVRTCILVHDAIEREFNFDIDDKKYLLISI